MSESIRSTGIIIKVIDRGRITIPDHFRRDFNWHKDDKIQVFINDAGSIVIKKVTPKNNE